MELEEVAGVVPGGRWAWVALGLLAIPGVRRQLRPVAKAALGAGIGLFDQARELAAEAREQTNDMIAEVRAEREQVERNGTPAASAARPAGRRGA